jgi:hypothetical protein
MSVENLNDGSLWNNPAVVAAKAAMTPEQLADYDRQGEYMFSGVDFVTSKSLATMPAQMVEAVAYVRESLKSGQHPSSLTDNEKALLLDAHGEGWWKEYGYAYEDLHSIVTVSRQ